MKYKSIKIASILGIIGNIFLMIIKGLIGFSTNSQSMIADFFNSAGDIFSSVMTYIGNSISSRAADEDHNLGHGKAEYIYSLFISLVMIGMCLIVIKDSIFNIINGSNFIFNNLLVVVCIITIITKFSLYLYTSYLSKKYDNILIKANSMDHRNDCILTFLNLIACILSKYNVLYVDSIVGIVISGWISYQAYEIFMESYNVLMDKAMDNKTRDEVFEVIRKYDEIKDINHFNSTPVGYQYQISFTIFVDGKMSTYKSHEIANKLEKEIVEKFDDIYLCVIHVNPI